MDIYDDGIHGCDYIFDATDETTRPPAPRFIWHCDT